MGTRAIVEKGKLFLATHWDGDPDWLGKHILQYGKNNKKLIAVIKKHHHIDFRNKLAYGDFAEWQYVIKGDKVYYRPLSGEYPESLKNAEEFKLLGTLK